MLKRRTLCRASLLAGAGLLPAIQLANAQSLNAKTKTQPYVAQIFDTSLSQQDVSRDFMIGSRCAWQELQANNKSNHFGIGHKSIEVDGNAATLESTLNTLASDPNCIALTGTVGQNTARWMAEALEKQSSAPGNSLIQIAPWLHDGRAGFGSLRIFATQEAQIAHALKSLAVVGLKEVGVVFANAAEQRAYDFVLKRLAQLNQLQIKPYVAQQGFYQLGAQLGQDTPAVLLFMSGTPELAQFSKGTGKANRHRYAIGMADINTQTLQQMGLGRNVPVVITQVVPVITSALPVVRDYRAALSKFFDEPPSALSLSGYISAKLTQRLLAQANARTRAQVAALSKTQWQIDLGGYVVEYDGQQLVKAYVTQSMVASDGRLIG